MRRDNTANERSKRPRTTRRMIHAGNATAFTVLTGRAGAKSGAGEIGGHSTDEIGGHSTDSDKLAVLPGARLLVAIRAAKRHIVPSSVLLNQSLAHGSRQSEESSHASRTAWPEITRCTRYASRGRTSVQTTIRSW